MCCWKCEPCNPWMFLENEVTCTDCGPGRWPYEHKRGCYDLDIQYMRWDSLLALIPVCVACFGILLTVTVITIFIRQSETPIVKVFLFYLCYFCSSSFLFSSSSWEHIYNLIRIGNWSWFDPFGNHGRGPCRGIIFPSIF